MKFEVDQQLRDRKNIEKGKLENKFEIAKNLLDILEDSVIALKTGLSISEVQKLREST